MEFRREECFILNATDVSIRCGQMQNNELDSMEAIKDTQTWIISRNGGRAKSKSIEEDRKGGEGKGKYNQLGTGCFSANTQGNSRRAWEVKKQWEMNIFSFQLSRSVRKKKQRAENFSLKYFDNGDSYGQGSDHGSLSTLKDNQLHDLEQVISLSLHFRFFICTLISLEVNMKKYVV